MLWGPGFKIYHFCFSAVAEAVCTPTMATCVFSLLTTPNDKTYIFPSSIALILGNSFHPTFKSILCFISINTKHTSYACRKSKSKV